MRQNYFIHNGKKYKSGDIVIIKELISHYTCTFTNKKVKFLYYENDKDLYIVEYNNNIETYTGNFFSKFFCGSESDVLEKQKFQFANTNVNENNKRSLTDELNVDGLFIAWVWYIVIMMFAAILYDRIFIWVIASIIFFNYRNKKLKEAGYK